MNVTFDDAKFALALSGYMYGHHTEHTHNSVARAVKHVTPNEVSNAVLSRGVSIPTFLLLCKHCGFDPFSFLDPADAIPPPYTPSTGGLTQQQHQLLKFITHFIEENQYSPSYTEMLRHLGLNSKSGVHRLVSCLEERGFVKRMPDRARSIQILKRVA